MTVTYLQLFLMGSSLAMMAILYFTIQRTKIGRSIRAVASRERIAKRIKRFPRRDRWLVVGPRCVHRMFD